MKLPYIKNQILKNEKGQTLIFAAFLAMALLVVGGLAVDTAHVFLRKSQFRRAMDASAMAGITRYQRGVTDATAIENAAVQMARYNLEEIGLSDEEITSVSADFEIDANQVATLAMSAVITVPTFFMRLIPGAGLDSVTINGGSVSRRVPAVLSLILDASGSMSCNGGCPEKFQALKDAANSFVDSFEDNLDRMAIVRFSNRADLIHPMSLVNKTALHAAINSLSASGWTNISESVSMGRIQIETVNNPEAVKAIVLFTDGAPNTFRAYFTNAKQPPLTKNYPAVNPIYWDYILFTAESPIRVKDPATLAVKCTGQGSADVRNCFNSLAYRDSRFNVRVGSGTISRTSRPAMKKESYHLGIIEADYAKTDDVTVYTIGLGDPAWEGNDPYQNINEDQEIKSYLLRRIANDPETASDPQFPGLANDPTHPVGAYFQTPDPNDLISLFETVALRIKLRLIQ